MVDADQLIKIVAANMLLGGQLLRRAGAFLVTKGISEAGHPGYGF